MARKHNPSYDYETGALLPAVEPPRPLEKYGQALWDGVQHEYQIRDIGGVETLAQICEAVDLIGALGVVIKAEGAVVQTQSTRKAHPCIREQTQLRAFVVRSLQTLGLTVEAVKSHLGSKPRSNDQAFEVTIPDFD
jgi:hypothetical protein